MIDTNTAKEIQELSKQGKSLSFIAKQFGISWLTARKYAAGEGNSERDKSKPSHNREAMSPRVIPVSNPSPRVIDQREDVEITELQVRKQKAMTELEKVIPQREHPLVVERKARFETKKLDLDEFKVDRELQALREEERRKAQIEEEVRIERERERRRIEEERKRAEAHEKWVRELQDRSLLRGISLPWGFSLSTKAKFEVRDAIKKALETRSENENGDEIRKLIREISQATIQPYIDRFEEDKRIEKTKQEAAELERKEKGAAESKARVERVKKERERVETEEKAFWEKVKEKREKERVEELVQAGMSRFNYYLLANRKELGAIDAKEQERARRYLERELKEEVEGNETDEEVEKIADQTLDHFFFE